MEGIAGVINILKKAKGEAQSLSVKRLILQAIHELQEIVKTDVGNIELGVQVGKAIKNGEQAVKSEEIIDEIREQNPELLLADGFENAILGTVQVFSNEVVLYDRERCIEILMTRDGMSKEDAEEYFEFNVTGAYVGEKTPGFATVMRK